MNTLATDNENEREKYSYVWVNNLPLSSTFPAHLWTYNLEKT